MTTKHIESVTQALDELRPGVVIVAQHPSPDWEYPGRIPALRLPVDVSARFLADINAGFDDDWEDPSRAMWLIPEAEGYISSYELASRGWLPGGRIEYVEQVIA